MANVVEAFDFTNNTSVRTLLPGQIGKTTRGTTEGKFVMGIPHTLLKTKSERSVLDSLCWDGLHYETAFAVRLDTGELITEDEVMVIAYPEHVLLQVRPSHNMGTKTE